MTSCMLVEHGAKMKCSSMYCLACEARRLYGLCATVLLPCLWLAQAVWPVHYSPVALLVTEAGCVACALGFNRS